MKAIVVSGPRASDWREVELPGGDAQLPALQAAVGGYIEAVGNIDSAVATVFCHEEGAIRNLPIFAQRIEKMGAGHSVVIDALHGPLVLMGPVDSRGDTQGITPAALAYIRERIRPVQSREPGVLVCTFDPCTRCKGSGYEPATPPAVTEDQARTVMGGRYPFNDPPRNGGDPDKERRDFVEQTAKENAEQLHNEAHAKDDTDAEDCDVDDCPLPCPRCAARDTAFRCCDPAVRA